MCLILQSHLTPSFPHLLYSPPILLELLLEPVLFFLSLFSVLEAVETVQTTLLRLSFFQLGLFLLGNFETCGGSTATSTTSDGDETVLVRNRTQVRKGTISDILCGIELSEISVRRRC